MQLGPDVGLVFWTVVTFALLLVLLSKFVFGPLRAVLAKREQAIRDSLDEARRAREMTEDIQARQAEQLEAAREQARQIIQEGRRVALSMEKEGRDRAKQEADKIIEQARGEIDKQLVRSLEELRGTVVNLSMRVARQVILDDIDENRHKNLVDGYIERLKKSRERKIRQ